MNLRMRVHGREWRTGKGKIKYIYTYPYTHTYIYICIHACMRTYIHLKSKAKGIEANNAIPQRLICLTTLTFG